MVYFIMFMLCFCFLQTQIAGKLGIPVSDVKNVIIWGNHSSTQFPDLRHATAHVNGQDVPVYDAIKDDAYLKGDFITVSSRLHIF